MPEPMTRPAVSFAVRKSGPSGSILYAPPEWLEINGLHWGDRVTMSIAQDGSLIVTPVKKVGQIK